MCCCRKGERREEDCTQHIVQDRSIPPVISSCCWFSCCMVVCLLALLAVAHVLPSLHPHDTSISAGLCAPSHVAIAVVRGSKQAPGPATPVPGEPLAVCQHNHCTGQLHRSTTLNSQSSYTQEEFRKQSNKWRTTWPHRTARGATRLNRRTSSASTGGHHHMQGDGTAATAARKCMQPEGEAFYESHQGGTPGAHRFSFKATTQGAVGRLLHTGPCTATLPKAHGQDTQRGCNTPLV